MEPSNFQNFLISLKTGNFPNTTGHHFTQEQANLIRRYMPRSYSNFNHDRAALNWFSNNVLTRVTETSTETFKEEDKIKKETMTFCGTISNKDIDAIKQSLAMPEENLNSLEAKLIYCFGRIRAVNAKMDQTNLFLADRQDQKEGECKDETGNSTMPILYRLRDLSLKLEEEVQKYHDLQALNANLLGFSIE